MTVSVGCLSTKRLEEFGNVLAAFVPLHQHHGLARMIIHRPQPIAFRGGAGRWNHDLLSLGTPHLAQRRVPTHIEFVGIVKDFIAFQVVTRFFNRLFLTWYSGSGLLILCCGRLITIPAALRCSRTVSIPTRIPVCSAR